MRALDFTEVINNENYFTVKQFARVTGRSEQNVRFLICYGNRIRKIRIARIGTKPMIPYSEYLDYPFTMPGRGSSIVYHYTASGQVVESNNGV